MHYNNLRNIALGILAAGAMSSVTHAANSAFAPGDLVLFFQDNSALDSPTGKTVYVNLGDAATLYRRSSTGVDGPSVFNITNIGATLTTAFGPGWQSNANIYAGLAGVWDTTASAGFNTMLNNDPSRTLYFSQARNDVGEIGTSSSTTPTGFNNTNMTTGAQGIFAMNNVFDDPSGANGYNSSVAISNKDISQIDNYNQLTTVGPTTIQQPAFDVVNGGVMQQGGAGEFGDFTWVPDVEFSLVSTMNRSAWRSGSASAINT